MTGFLERLLPREKLLSRQYNHSLIFPFETTEMLDRFELYVTDYRNAGMLSNPLFEIERVRIDRDTVNGDREQMLRKEGAKFTCSGTVILRKKRFPAEMDFEVTSYVVSERVVVKSYAARVLGLACGDMQLAIGWEFLNNNGLPRAILDVEGDVNSLLLPFAGLPTQDEFVEDMQIVKRNIISGFKGTC